MLAIVWLALGLADARRLRLLARHKWLFSTPETQEHAPMFWRAAGPARGVVTGRAQMANCLGHDPPKTQRKNVGNHQILTGILYMQVASLFF